MTLWRKLWLTAAIACAGIACAGAAAQRAHAAPLGTAFTYQGQLQRSGEPADDSCDFQFALYDAAAGGTQLGSTQTLAAIGVADGVFTVQLNESGQFGPSAFGGEQRWLQIGVRCPAGSGSYTALSPRQEMTATPYARYAPAAGSMPWNGLTGMPAAFSDGTDDNTTYTAGTGLVLSGTQFSVNFGASGNAVATGNHTHGGQQWTATTSPGLFVNDTALNGTAIIGTASGTGPGAVGVAGGSGNGVGVVGSSTAGVGIKGLTGDPSAIVPAVAAVWGDSHTNAGVIGTSDDYFGVHGRSTNGDGVYGFTLQGLNGVFGEAAGGSGNGVYGRANGANAWGVYGESDSGKGVRGRSFGGVGVNGKSTNGVGVLGESDSSAGVQASSIDYDAVRAESAGANRSGVYGVNSHASGYGVFGRHSSSGSTGYLGGNYIGVRGTSLTYEGALGTNSIGVYGLHTQTGNYGGLGGTSYAGYFVGKVEVDGDLSVQAGHTKNFKIDHPLDAVHKYLYHFSVESNEVTNLYHGIVMLDEHGEAEVTLPAWFAAANRDPRYQLTCIGRFAPVYIAEEITANRFKIAGGEPGMKVSWQVTGIRNDPSIRRHSHPVEEDKPAEEQGTYLDPEAYGQPAEKSVEWVRQPEVMRRLQAVQARSAGESE